MNVLILEDEGLAAERASNLLLEYDKNINLTTVDSCQDAYSFLNSNPPPELILSDIQLGDGLSFELFSKLQINSPVIFMTAYQQYAIDAFKVNAVDYLLKPIVKDDLFKALKKHKTINIEANKINLLNEQFSAYYQQFTNNKVYKSRFLVKTGSTILFKNIGEVAYFFADDKIVYLVSREGKHFMVDYRLEELENYLDPSIFFRINRKFYVNIESILKVKMHFSSRLEVFLNPNFNQEIYISREKVAIFKAWLDK
jgi:two-component system, LytTR family, response regulator LytT